MQLCAIEFARNVLNLKDASSTEFDENTSNPVITILYKPNLNVPPLLTILALSSRIVITGLDVFSSNSVEDASFKFKLILLIKVVH